MEDFTDTNTLPLSITQVHSTLYEDQLLASERAAGATADVSEVREQLLAAVVTMLGEVESAEWALDQAKAACHLQITAAPASGVPVDKVAAATGLSASAVRALREQDPVRPED